MRQQHCGVNHPYDGYCNKPAVAKATVTCDAGVTRTVYWCENHVATAGELRRCSAHDRKHFVAPTSVEFLLAGA